MVARAQLKMLAELLGVPLERIRYLERLDAPALRALCRQISDWLFDSESDTFRRISALSPFAPAPLVARIAETVVPPLVGGIIGGALGIDHPVKAVAVLSRLDADYMAACAPHVDPRAIELLAPKLPPEPFIPAARVLLAREEFATAARFVEVATRDLIEAFEAAIEDDTAIIDVAGYVYSDDVVNEIVRVLPHQRILGALVAAREGGVTRQLAAMSLIARLDADLRLEYAPPLFEQLSDEQMRTLLEHALAAGLGDDMRTVADGLGLAFVGQEGNDDDL